MPAIIEVADLVKRYRKADRNAVDGVSFEVEAGQFFALLGPNGAGKTTTISILTTTLTATSGRVSIAGHDLRQEANQVRRSVGIIFQRPSLDRNLSGEENVRLHAVLYGLYPFRPSFSLMADGYRRQILELAAVLGIERDVFKPVNRLSGGMMRKLEIIRGLMHNPKVLFLDEPTAGLDAASRRSLWEYLRQVRERHQTTIFLTTHNLQEAEEADRICILNLGRVVAYGTTEELKSQLIEEHLLLDAQDRERLRSELRGLGIVFQEGDHLRVELDGRSAHGVIRSIQTPLNLLRVHAPSLEDVYLKITAAEESVN